MYAICVLFCVLLSAGFSISTSRELMIDDLECLETCQLEQYRYCLRPPHTCGDCLPSYAPDSRGLCRPEPSQAKKEAVETPSVQSGRPVDQIIAPAGSSETQVVERAGNSADQTADGPQAQVVESGAGSTGSSQHPVAANDMTNEVLLIAIIVACSAILIIAIIIAIICSYRMHRLSKEASEVEYPAYGSTGPYQGAPRSGVSDRKMAQSAQMYHYQHQKQQMLEIEKSTNGLRRASDVSSGGESDDEQLTVYECPGLATTTGEMEVNNPLFQEPVDVVGAPGAPVPNGRHAADKK